MLWAGTIISIGILTERLNPCTTQDSKLPVPDVAKQKEVEKQIRDIFKNEYVRSSPQARLELAKKLLSQTQEAKDDPNAVYVFYREARDLAVQAGNLQFALDIVDRMTNAFAIDPFVAKLELLAAFEKSANTASDRKTILGAYLNWSQEAVSSDEFDHATTLMEGALAFATHTKTNAAVTEVQAMIKMIAGRKGRFALVRKARGVLLTNPEDPTANLQVGEYECLVKGNWSVALPFLTKAKEGELKALAQKELMNATDPSDLLALAEGWFNQSEKADRAAKGSLRARSLMWYEKATPFTSGLAKTKAYEKLAELRMDKFDGPDWIALTDPNLFGRKGVVGSPMEADYFSGKGVIQLSKLPEGVFDAISVRIRCDAPKDRACSAMVHFHSNKYAIALLFPLSSGGVQVLERLATGWHVLNPNPYLGIYNRVSYLTIVLGDRGCTVYVDGFEWFTHKLPSPVTKVVSLTLEAQGGLASFDKVRLRKCKQE